MRSEKARIYDNNHLAASTASITAPDDGSFPFSNALDGMRRGLPWNPDSKSFTVTIDLRYNANVSLFAIFGPSNSNLGLSTAATVTLKGNMIDVFDGSEPFNEQVPIYDIGAFLYLDTDSSTEGQQYRYWNIVFDDTTNPSDVFINYIFLGDALTFEFNIQRGFNLDITDQTLIETSDSGVIYTSQKPQFTSLSGLEHRFIGNSTKQQILKTIQSIGLHTPFILSLDPTEQCFDINDSHFLAYFNTLPRFRHIKASDFNVNYDIREVL